MQRRTFVAATAATLAAPMIRAQNLPTGPVRIIVGFAPGGGTDILARVIGQKLGDMWKTQVLVENKAGASGTIAADYVAKQPGDGNTLLMAHINSQAITPALQKVNYDPAKDFQPITLVGVTPNLLICNENQPAKTVKDLVELCRKNPGQVSFGSAGTGSAQHLALEMFMLAAKVKGRMFRIGHLGDCNDLTLMGALSGCEMGLKLAGVKLAGSGVQAAMDYFASHPVPIQLQQAA